MTVSSFNSLSLDPPLVLFSIDRRAASLPLWERAEAVAVHVLAENQKDISNRFAPLWPANGKASREQEGLAARRCCRAWRPSSNAPWTRYEGGDHTLFILTVERFLSFADRGPLVFGKGRYAALQSSDVAAPLWPLDIHY